MKKFLVAFVAIMIFSMASAAKDYFGVYAGYPGGLGVQYTMNDSLRIGVGIPFFYGGFGIDAAVDLFLGGDALDKANPALNWYYGAGLGAFYYGTSVLGASYSVIALFPHGLAGINYDLSPGLSLFFEADLGIDIFL